MEIPFVVTSGLIASQMRRLEVFLPLLAYLPVRRVFTDKVPFYRLCYLLFWRGSLVNLIEHGVVARCSFITWINRISRVWWQEINLFVAGFIHVCGCYRKWDRPTFCIVIENFTYNIPVKTQLLHLICQISTSYFFAQNSTSHYRTFNC